MPETCSADAGREGNPPAAGTDRVRRPRRSRGSPVRPGAGNLSASLRSTVLAALAVAWVGCTNEGPEEGGSADDAEEVGEPGVADAPRVYERMVHFVPLAPGVGEEAEAELGLAASMIFQASVGDDRVDTRTRAWAADADGWVPLLDHERITEDLGAPWRILPGGGVRIVAGYDDAVESVILPGEGGELELRFGEFLAEWRGGAGEAYRLHRGSAIRGGEAVDGFLLEEIGRRPVRARAQRERILLVDGANLRLFVEAAGPERSAYPEGPDGNATLRPDEARRAQAWTRSDFRNQSWPEVSVRWTSMRAFDAARREVPSSWAFTTRGQELQGEIEAVSAHLREGEGEGPMLPVLALHRVQGTVRFEGREHRVRGIVLHWQP